MKRRESSRPFSGLTFFVVMFLAYAILSRFVFGDSFDWFLAAVVALFTAALLTATGYLERPRLRRTSNDAQ